MDQSSQLTSPPSTPSRSSRLTSYQFIQVKALRNANWSYNRITKHLGIKKCHVRYAAQVRYVEVKTSPGRPTVLSPKDIDDVEVFITSNPDGRRMSWLELLHGPFRHLGSVKSSRKGTPEDGVYPTSST